MRVEQLMNQPAITCMPSDTLDTAARLMWENDCGVIPVVDDGGRLVGMITDRDICMSAYTKGEPLHQLPVSGAMAREVVACHPQDSIDTAEHLMSEAQVRRIPVVDDRHRPTGVLSFNDIARHAASARTSNGFDHEIVQTLAAICRPRERPPALASWMAAPEPVPAGM